MGNGLTVTVERAVFVQPFPSVPVTVYDVVELSMGVVVLAPFGKPPVHVYDIAPLAIKLAVCPTQIVGEFTVTLGLGLTVIVDIAVFLQPFTSVPVTVYDVFEFKIGVVGFAPFGKPPLQV
jgi:hypothetical protein